jgi:hypothetical protein
MNLDIEKISTQKKMKTGSFFPLVSHLRNISFSRNHRLEVLIEVLISIFQS